MFQQAITHSYDFSSLVADHVGHFVADQVHAIATQDIFAESGSSDESSLSPRQTRRLISLGLTAVVLGAGFVWNKVRRKS